MSTVEPIGPTALEQNLGVTAQEAQIIADALEPIEKFGSAASGVGSALQDAPGAGPRLVGVMLENMATAIQFTTLNMQTFTRAVEFYVETQTKGLQEVFPPPSEVKRQVDADLEPLVEALFPGE